MPFKIQRVPRGLNELLSISGGLTPVELEDRVAASLDMLRFYGIQQLQTRTSTDPAAVQGSGTGVTLSSTQWAVLHGADVGVTLQAAMTALATGIVIRRNTSGFVSVAQGHWTSAFTVGGLHVISWRPDTPVLCPPGTIVFGGLDKLQGVANAALSITCEFGILS